MHRIGAEQDSVLGFCGGDNNRPCGSVTGNILACWITTYCSMNTPYYEHKFRFALTRARVRMGGCSTEGSIIPLY